MLADSPSDSSGGGDETATGLALLAHHGLRLATPPIGGGGGGGGGDGGGSRSSSGRPLSPRDGNTGPQRVARRPAHQDDWRSCERIRIVYSFVP